MVGVTVLFLILIATTEQYCMISLYGSGTLFVQFIFNKRHKMI